MMIPTIKVIDELGGSGTIQEIAEGVQLLLNLPEDATSRPHNPEKSSRTEVEYRLAWARTYLKKVGLIENSERGVWSFTDRYRRGMKLDAEEIVRTVRGLTKHSKKKAISTMLLKPSLKRVTGEGAFTRQF
jgi:restriction system protein